MGQFVIQPGDFLIRTNTYGSNNLCMAIFEGKPTPPSYSSTAKPDYSLLAYYEKNPFEYTAYRDGRTPGEDLLDVATPEKMCPHKIYVIENPTTWRLCTPAEKAQFIDILDKHGYHWSDETNTLANKTTGECMSIVVPKAQYNGQTIKIQTTAISKTLEEISKAEAEKIYMPQQPPVYQHANCYR